LTYMTGVTVEAVSVVFAFKLAIRRRDSLFLYW
jgi:hypothetical protein